MDGWIERTCVYSFNFNWPHLTDIQQELHERKRENAMNRFHKPMTMTLSDKKENTIKYCLINRGIIWNKLFLPKYLNLRDEETRDVLWMLKLNEMEENEIRNDNNNVGLRESIKPQMQHQLFRRYIC